MQKGSSFLMMLTLLWLTISAPFVFNSSQETARQKSHSTMQLPDSSSEEDGTNPFGNNNEEKSSGNSSFSEEFLHDHSELDHFNNPTQSFGKNENTALYVAFHGELLVPPPDHLF
jgi:hypothetical protein